MSLPIKKFDFRCCIDEDLEDIQRLLEPIALESIILSTTQQWYCLESDETGDELLAVGRLTIVRSQPVKIDLVRFTSLSKDMYSSQSQLISAQQYFIQKLTHVSQQFSESADRLELLLNDYDETFVNMVVSLGWQEKGGYFSTEMNSMVHEFVFGKSDTMPPPMDNTTFDLEFEVVDEGNPDSGMRNLMESLFIALHKEEGKEGS